jgi:NitT/TauT family transport system substrate-binding protein
VSAIVGSDGTRLVRRREFLGTIASASAALVARPARAQSGAITLASTSASVGLITQLMKRAKLDEKHEVKLDVKLLDPAAAEKTVLLRQVDAGLFPVISAADVNTKGQDIVLFGPLLYMHSFAIVWKDSPANDLTDLKGKKIGLLDKVSGAYRGMQILAARRGLDFERDFQPVTGPPPAVITFLQRRQVDAIVIFEPVVSKLLAEGNFRVLMGMNEEWKKRTPQNWLFLCLAAHRDWLEKNRAAAARITATLLDASRMIASDSSQVAAEAEFLQLKTKAEIDLARERLPQFFPTEWNDAAVKNVMETVREAARLKQIREIPAKDFVTVLRG